MSTPRVFLHFTALQIPNGQRFPLQFPSASSREKTNRNDRIPWILVSRLLLLLLLLLGSFHKWARKLARDGTDSRLRRGEALVGASHWDALLRGLLGRRSWFKPFTARARFVFCSLLSFSWTSIGKKLFYPPPLFFFFFFLWLYVVKFKTIIILISTPIVAKSNIYSNISIRKKFAILIFGVW